jgi:hypothetical protein
MEDVLDVARIVVTNGGTAGNGIPVGI